MSKIKALPKYLTLDETKRLLDIITNKRDRAIFTVAYRYGLRASEVGLLKVADLDITNQRIRITRLKGSYGGEYPVQPDTMRVLKAWLKIKPPGPILFPSQLGRPISRRHLDYLMKKYGAMADVPGDKCHFHSLKHSIGTHLTNAGVQAQFVQSWLGHKDIKSTMVYSRITDPSRDEIAEKIFAVPGVGVA